MITQFDQVFPSNQISSFLQIENFSDDAFDLLIPLANPASFNINVNTSLTFNFPHTFFRNRTTIFSPEIIVFCTQVIATISGTNSLSSQNVIQGFPITIDLTNNSWKPTSLVPVNFVCRSNESNGWNQNVTTTLTYESESKLTIHVRPTPQYKISSIEIIDVYILKDGTHNQKLHYVGNFTIQGSSLVERNHHNYNRNIQKLIMELNNIKNKIHNVKLSMTSSPKIEFETQGNFNINDTLHQRLLKINSSEIQHPISICRPPLINGNETMFIQTTLTNILNELINYTIQKNFPQPLCVPILCPDFVTKNTTQLFSILLSRPLPISLTINGSTTHATTQISLPAAQIHTITLHPTDSELTISGYSIQTVSFHRST